MPVADRQTEGLRGVVTRLAGLAVRRPRAVLGTWIAAVALLSLIGLDIQSRLQSNNTHIAGSESAIATTVEQSRFGGTEALAITLTGPASAIERDGRRAARAVDRIRSVDLLTPWDRGAPTWLKHSNGEILLIAQVRASFRDTGIEIVPKVRRALHGTVSKDVDTRVVGTTLFGVELTNLVVESSTRAELAAAPILLLVLLVIFRSLVAAAVPLLLGFSVIQLGTGLLALATRLTTINPNALGAMSLIGLALGVDYALIIVSRFREELAEGGDASSAVMKIAATAGKTVFTAGLIVAAGMAIVMFFVPGELLVSVIGASLMAALLSGLLALTVVPAALSVLGSRIDNVSLRPSRRSGQLGATVSRLIRRPAVASIVLLIPLVAFSAHAIGLQTGPVDARVLPKDNTVLTEYFDLADRFGEGWAGPLVVIIHRPNQPLTDYPSLRAINDFQKDLGRDPEIAHVLGPAGLAEVARTVRDTTANAPTQLARLDEGIEQASSGSKGLSDGLGELSEGSGELASGATTLDQGSKALASGADQVAQGTSALDSGIGKAAQGSKDLSSGVASLSTGAKRLKEAATEASSGALALAGPADSFRAELAESKASLARLKEAPATAKNELTEAKAALEAAPLAVKSDPNYKSAYESIVTATAALSGFNPFTGQQIAEGYAGIEEALAKAERQASLASTQASKLAQGTEELAGGLGELEGGSKRLASGTDRAHKGSAQLQGALYKASSGTHRLGAGTQELHAGANRLSGGLGRLSAGSKELSSGTQAAHRGSARLSRGLGRLDHELNDSGAELSNAGATGDEIDFKAVSNSGHLLLAALEGVPKSDRKGLDMALNTDRGGDAVRMVVISRDIPTDSHVLIARLRARTAELGEKVNANARLGGPGAVLYDYDRTTEGRRIPLLVVVSLVTLLFLICVFRSPLLAFKAVILNLLVVGFAFGIQRMLFEGSDPLLGGPGFIDVIVFFMVYGTVFTLSIDYEIFMINRMRETYLKTDSNEQAIREGLIKSAPIITGAAAAMICVFASFAVFGAGNARQFGLVLAVAVAIDATVVRLVLLPATMRLFGRANWWIPKWLDRRLPNLSVG